MMDHALICLPSLFLHSIVLAICFMGSKWTMVTNGSHLLRAKSDG